MRLDLHFLFHELREDYRASAAPLPDMALVNETVDLDWLTGILGPLRRRFDVLARCLLNRACFMERMQGEDLVFGTKKAVEGLKDVRNRIKNNIKIIEDRMNTLILCTYENQNYVVGLSAHLLTCAKKRNEMCSHHDEDPEGDRHNNLPFPIARRYRQQVAGKGVVDAYMEYQRKRLQKYLLAKLGIHVFDRDEGTVLVTGWNSLIDHERAHIVAGYFRRVIFNESHLFVQAHFHTRAFKDRAIELPEIMTLEGETLDLTEEIGASIFCMIAFLLNPSLSVSDLEFLCDYVTWPAVVEVRAAAQDVILDIKAFEEAKQKPGRPYWAHLIQPGVLKRNRIKPEGALPVLCGTLYEASYYQTLRPNTFEPRFWSHIASLVRCETCLFSLIQSSRQWCDLVRIFAAHRVPLYDRRLPHISGLVPEDFWCTDRACDDIRGGLLRRCLEMRGQAPLGRYRLDELLEMAGVTMLGIVEGGPVDMRGITKALAVR
ncbi:hypothetical protein FRC09_005165, partial [Ceratobasidium sp. 395]